ncbi:MAG: sulfatase-like hydrolase/transferase [Candidatus Hodarchaeota archaeon]
MEKIERIPNIIIFVADEMRGDCVSLGGKRNHVIKTPNIDNLAKDGFAFTNCFTVNPVCVPSRIAVFTGQYAHSSGHRSLYQLLKTHEENLFKFLKDKGYEVIYIGRNDAFSKDAFEVSVSQRIPIKLSRKWKTNPFPKTHSLRKSFYYGERTQEQAKDIDYFITKKAIEYIGTLPKRPFCLFIGFNFPHPPYTIEEPYFSMYKRDQIPSPIPANLDDKPKFMQLIHKRYKLDKLNEDDFREIIATYYGMITRLDYQLGKIINKLKEIGEYDNSAIFFFSDHGDYAGNYGLSEKWPNAFQDCLINIPLVVKIPKIQITNKIFDQLIESIDIFPTIMELAEIETKYTHFGQNLIPLLNGETKVHRDAVFAEGGYNVREPQCFEPVIKDPDAFGWGIYFDKTNIPKDNPSTVARAAMIRTTSWKLIIRDIGKEELYDLKNDSKELNNLIDSSNHTKVKTELKEKLLRWYLKTSDNADWRRERLV